MSWTALVAASNTQSLTVCSATHTADTSADADAKASPSSRPGSGVKESKLKQPEVKILDRHRPASSSSPSMPAAAGPSISDASGAAKPEVPAQQQRAPRAESKMGYQVATAQDSALHTARSVQSLANEIRRIRSMRTGLDEPSTAADGGRKPNVAEKKSSGGGLGGAEGGRTRPAPIKLEIAGLEPILSATSHGPPGRQATKSPTLPGPGGFSLRPGSSGSPTVSSAGKKGIQRNFLQGLGSDFQLDLQSSSTDRLDRSYDLSASGTFDAVGFQIKQTGLTRSPDRDNERGSPSSQSGGQLQPSNTKKHLVKLGVLGRGASGVVHKALHVPSLLLVAVKVIPVFEHEKRHQLIAELKALYNNLSTLSDADGAEAVRQSVACPELVCLYDAFMNPNEGNVSIVVEYMDGGSLQDIVDTGGCTSEVVLANISFRVLKGLAFLHGTHQLHRDIKPSNLLINHFGDVKVSDFGIVREMENSMAKATTFVGTLTYMSPERIASEVPPSRCHIHVDVSCAANPGHHLTLESSFPRRTCPVGILVQIRCVVVRPLHHDLCIGQVPVLIAKRVLGAAAHDSQRTGTFLCFIALFVPPEDRELTQALQQPPRLPEGEFSDLFCDFLDKCLNKDQAQRWSVKQLLGHEFILKHCGKQVATPGGSGGASLSDSTGEEYLDARAGAGSDEDSKEQAEVDEIVQKVAEHYFKDAKELIVDHDYTLDDIVAWIQLLPAMQKV
ncbi:hypothetical protein BBJ28_00012849 [Nothophytophthora sp. Chile5]|nr:hypothetical protein BBJ28_00012849 [Nothophytophthora sp. Chile5]